jgi:hypothetical protein
VDGPNTIYRDHEFGIVFSVQHTEALGRMADFGKYLVNELPPVNSPARRSIEKNLVPTYRMGELQGRRDELEMNIREALGLFFDVRAIVFSPKDVQPRPSDKSGWEETVLAYIHVKAKDASVGTCLPRRLRTCRRDGIGGDAKNVEACQSTNTAAARGRGALPATPRRSVQRLINSWQSGGRRSGGIILG